MQCSLCGCIQPTTAHVLSSCLVALSQDRFTYWHDQVLHCLASKLSASHNTIHVYTDLPDMRASESPQGTIPSSLIITPYCPDIVIYNETCNLVALLELTCPLDSIHHLESAIDWKQSKEEYHQILSEFCRLGVPCHYDTVELSVLGHYLQSSLSSLYTTMNFVQQPMLKSQRRNIFDEAARFSISASRKIFLARNCSEWTHK